MANDITGNNPNTQYRNINLSTTGQIIKASPGQVFSMVLGNSAASIAYVKFYDKATAATSSDTPIRTVMLQASQTLSFSNANGIKFLTGISVRACTGVADNDNTAPSSNQIVVNIDWL